MYLQKSMQNYLFQHCKIQKIRNNNSHAVAVVVQSQILQVKVKINSIKRQ